VVEPDGVARAGSLMQHSAEESLARSSKAANLASEIV